MLTDQCARPDRVPQLVVGVTEGFKKELSVQGVGYRVANRARSGYEPRYCIRLP
ncbi:MAG: hypothetical protein ACLS69_07010 [Butyricicoccus sp.]